jgi:dihydrofolate reductase
MRYWDTDRPGWTPAEQEFAAAWRAQPKWVASSTLGSVGPDATLVAGDLATAACDLKDRLEGEIDVGGPALAARLGELGLIDEYRLYYHPVVLGRGAPFFAGARPRLRIVASDRVGDGVVRLTCVPA